MKNHKFGPVRRPFLFLALVIIATIAFAYARLGDGAAQSLAWFVVAFCTGGLISLVQRRA